MDLVYGQGEGACMMNTGSQTHSILIEEFILDCKDNKDLYPTQPELPSSFPILSPLCCVLRPTAQWFQMI